MTQSQAALTASDALNSSVTSTASKLTITQYQILITGKCPAGAEVSALKWSPDSVWRQQIVKWYKLIEICSRCCNKRCVRSDALRSSGWRCCVAGEDSAPSSPPCSLTLLTKLSGSQSQKSLHASLGSCVRRQPIGWAGPGRERAQGAETDRVTASESREEHHGASVKENPAPQPRCRTKPRRRRWAGAPGPPRESWWTLTVLTGLEAAVIQLMETVDVTFYRVAASLPSRLTC